MKSNQREKLGQQMVSDLFKIAQLTQQPIRDMRLNNNGVFEEVKKPVINHDLDQNMFSCVKSCQK
jgi:hypothetical protein